MLRFVPFEARHLDFLDLQPAQNEAREWVRSPEGAARLRATGIAMTGAEFDQDGSVRRVAGCAGITHQWRGRALAWTLIGAVDKPEWLAIVRQMAAAIRGAHLAGVRRIEATADAAFEPGCRLLDLLGFDEPRQLLRCYSPEGRDHYLYARVR